MSVLVLLYVHRFKVRPVQRVGSIVFRACHSVFSVSRARRMDLKFGCLISLVHVSFFGKSQPNFNAYRADSVEVKTKVCQQNAATLSVKSISLSVVCF